MALAGQAYAQISTTPSPKPGVVTLAVTSGASQDLEIIQWPDGGISLPVKAFTALYHIDTQISETDHRALFADPVSKKQVEIDWQNQTIQIDNVNQSQTPHPIMFVPNDLLTGQDVYVDQSVLTGLLSSAVKFDADTTTLMLNTKRALMLNSSANAETPTVDTGISETVVRNPEQARALVEKVYVHNTNTTVFQNSQQPVAVPYSFTPLYNLNNIYNHSLVNSPTIGINGSVWGQDYYLKPTFTTYNGKFNLQDVQWQIRHPVKGRMLRLGNMDMGLGPLVSPTINVWGLNFASLNALAPTLKDQNMFEGLGKAGSGNNVTARVNGHVVQTVQAQDEQYEFEPISLYPQAVNTVEVVETNTDQSEHIIAQRTVSVFPDLLSKAQSAYSTFAGRAALQFYPVLPNQNIPLLMPQSEKWMAGGRYFYGLTNRLTLGVETASDTIFGKPRTYYTALNPLTPDLTGFNSYLRDPNFFKGETIGTTLRYQVTDRWRISADNAVSRMTLLPGSRLNFSNPNHLGLAGKLQVERQGQRFAPFVNVFHYDPYFYSPSTTLYGSALYDKQGVGTGFGGALATAHTISYRFNWDTYQTNMSTLIPGGLINVNRLAGTLNFKINNQTNLFTSGNWVNGDNQQRHFLQHAYDVTLRTSALPRDIIGEAHIGNYYTNTLFLPTAGFISQLVQTRYNNNSFDTSLDFPIRHASTGLTERTTHFKIGNHVSTYFNDLLFDLTYWWHQWTIEPVIQKSYGNTIQTQDSVGLKLGYHMKNSGVISVYYFKNISTFNGSLPGIPRANINTHQFYIDFTNVIGLLAHRARSLGANGESMGILTGSVFADSNQNGKRDPGEPGIQNVSLIIDKQTTLKTDKNGYYTMPNLAAGYHNLELVPDNLPLTVSTDNLTYKIKIKDTKTYRYNIALVPEGGKLSGHVLVQDIKNNIGSAKGLILLLMNPDGQTVSYTSVEESGQYHFSNIATGNYTVDLETRQKDSGRYKILSAPAPVKVTPPLDLNTLSEIENLDFKILAL